MSVFLLVSNHIANGIIHGGKARMVCGIAKRENHRDFCVPRDQEKCDQDQEKKLTIMLLVVVKDGPVDLNLADSLLDVVNDT